MKLLCKTHCYRDLNIQNMKYVVVLLSSFAPLFLFSFFRSPGKPVAAVE